MHIFHSRMIIHVQVPCPAEVQSMLALDAGKMHEIKDQMLLQVEIRKRQLQYTQKR